MMAVALTGARVRAVRERQGLRQADLARRAGISAAYLNLIEHDRRRIGDALLLRLATALEVEAAALADGGAAARVEELRAAAAMVGQAPAEVDRTEEMAGRFPGWAELIAAQARRIGQLDRVVSALSDRIGHDPHLSAAVHEVLSAATSVRSTAAILAEGEVAPDWRRRFHANLHQDSERLAAGAEALVAYLEAAEGAETGAAVDPQEEVEDWLAARGWHLAEVEPGGPGAAALAPGIGRLATGAARALARDWAAQAAADAAAMPLEPLRAALDAAGGDPLRVAARFGVGGVAAMRRIATRPGAGEGLVICDASGAALIRKGIAGFPMPRGGGACPLWPLYAALGRPMVPVEAVAEVPGMVPQRFRVRAICEVAHPQGFGGIELRRAAMLIAPDKGPAGPVLPVGGACRICPREGCEARREPSILSAVGAASAAARAGQG
ncbi:MAG: short-chain fatty acyl-CoA regulator family protein [Gemmobacter sp.]